MLQLVEEPLVDFRQLVYLVYCVAAVHRLRYDEDAVVRRVAQGLVDVGYLEFLVLHEAVHALPYHAQAFLYGFLEVAPYGHHLADRLHRRAQLAVNAAELAEIPAGDFAHDIVQGRLEERAGSLGDRVLQLEQAVAKAQLRGDEGQGVARGLRGESRAAAQAGVDLYDAVVLTLGVKGVLHVAFAHDAYVAYYLD